MSNNENFHGSINSNIIDKIELVSNMVESNQLFLDSRGFIDLIDNEPTKEYIEYKNGSGYLSYNRGGIILSLRLLTGFSSGSFITKGQACFVEKMQKNCELDFKMENGLTVDFDLFNEVNDKILQSFYEYENDYYYDSDLTICEFRSFIDDDTNIITLDLSICYADSYFRSSSFEKIASLELDFSQFERIKLDTIEKFFRRALNRC